MDVWPASYIKFQSLTVKVPALGTISDDFTEPRPGRKGNVLISLSIELRLDPQSFIGNFIHYVKVQSSSHFTPILPPTESK